MPTVIVVLDSRRVSRALSVEAHELGRVRLQTQAWLDERAWALSGDVVCERGVRGRDDAPSVRSVAWQICGPTIFASEATRWILPGEAHLIDAGGARWRLPPEHVDAMGIRRVLREATLATGVSRPRHHARRTGVVRPRRVTRSRGAVRPARSARGMRPTPSVHPRSLR